MGTAICELRIDASIQVNFHSLTMNAGFSVSLDPMSPINREMAMGLAMLRYPTTTNTTAKLMFPFVKELINEENQFAKVFCTEIGYVDGEVCIRFFVFLCILSAFRQ